VRLMTLASWVFFLSGCGGPRALHSFPTRRSSDLWVLVDTSGSMAQADEQRPEWSRLDAARALAACVFEVALAQGDPFGLALAGKDRKSTRLNSSHVKISYAVFCLKKNTTYDDRET